ncbi:MAG: squalene--hopene cyclase, partial [Nannocystaceae bacterium]
RPDGGWGESFRGLHNGEDLRLPPEAPSSVVQTSWALLTLLALRPAQPAAAQAIQDGLRLLLVRQQADGSWPEEPASGVFFNTAVLDYKLYRQVFPTWAIARALRMAPKEPVGT